MDAAPPQPPPYPPSIAKTANPSLLIFDTDALIQLLICDEMRLLLFVKRTFGMQAAMVEAVEMEIRRGSFFKAKFTEELKAEFTKELEKAMETGVLAVLDTRMLPALVRTDANAVYNSIQSVGGQYARAGLDYGEAYTHAAGVVLHVPVTSNDLNGIKTARKKGLQLPYLIARVFDVVVLCHQASLIDADDCARIRKTLAAKEEFLPATFQHRSFQAGLGDFFARMVDGSAAPIGASNPVYDLDTRIVLARRC